METTSVRFSLFAKILSLACIILLATATVSFFSFKQAGALSERDDARALEVLLLKTKQNRTHFLQARDTNDIRLFDSLSSHFHHILVPYLETESGNTLDSIMDKYNTAYFSLTEAVRKRGLNEKSGIEGAFRKSVHNVEDILKQYSNDKMQVQLLQARRSEKDFIMRGTDKYIGRVEKAITTLQSLAQQTAFAISTKDSIEQLSNLYVRNFKEMVTVYKELQALEVTFMGLEQQGFTLLESTIAEKEEIVQAMQTTMLIVIALAFVLGIGAALLMGKSFVKPVRELQAAVQLMANGKTDVHVEITTTDEIGVLGSAFNTMAKNISASNV